MVLNLSQLIKSFGTRTVPAAETESIGLPAYAQLSEFLQSHLYNFTVTQDSQTSTGISPFRQFYMTTKLSANCRDFVSGSKTLIRLPGLCKNSCQRMPQTATKLNRRTVICKVTMIFPILSHNVFSFNIRLPHLIVSFKN